MWGVGDVECDHWGYGREIGVRGLRGRARGQGASSADAGVGEGRSDMVVGDEAPTCFDLEKMTGLEVLPHYIASEVEMRLLEHLGLNPIHTINAWEEAGGRTLVSRAPQRVVGGAHPRSDGTGSCCMEMVQVDLKSGVAVME